MYSYISPTLNAMINAARKAGRLLTRDFHEISNVEIKYKSAKDFVTSADLRSEKLILQDLKDFQPDYNCLSEENGFQAGEHSNFTWIVDPLDGTANFLQGIPFFSISIALRKKNDITHGVIYDPVLDNIYYAEKGSGAYMNNTRIRTPLKTKLDTNGMASFDYRHYIENEKLREMFHYVRYLGAASLSLAYVACGKLDLFVGQDLKVWDIAAGIVIIKEAGGRVDDLEKKQNVLEAPQILAGNAAQFEKMQRVLKIKINVNE